MFATPSQLSEGSRKSISAALLSLLADGLDLYSQIKVAHWNVRGPQFAALHPLFETFAVSLANHTDEIAERAVTLGSLARGTSRHVAASSRIPEYPQEVTRDLEHVGLLAERFDVFLKSLRSTRSVAEKEVDTDTVDLLTGVISEFEKHGWMLRASLS